MSDQACGPRTLRVGVHVAPACRIKKKMWHRQVHFVDKNHIFVSQVEDFHMVSTVDVIGTTQAPGQLAVDFGDQRGVYHFHFSNFR